jgi:hypothetical protein
VGVAVKKGAFHEGDPSATTIEEIGTSGGGIGAKRTATTDVDIDESETILMIIMTADVTVMTGGEGHVTRHTERVIDWMRRAQGACVSSLEF